MKKIIAVFGTRPEAIKMATVVCELRKSYIVKVCVTAQHRQMLDQVLDLFKIKPDYDLNIMQPNQDLFDITINTLKGVKRVLSLEKPNLVLVHGDTTTSMASAMAAFYLKIPVGHIEAGLRTYDIDSPFPEEFNRQITSKIALFHFAPTESARNNLLDENILDKKIFVTGNTVIDALFSILNKARAINFSSELMNKISALNTKNKRRIILVTGHRRENFGQGFEDIFHALVDIAIQNPDIDIVYPLHLNPNVRNPANKILNGINNIHLIEPMEYLLFIKLIDLSYLIITDSGGIQEEAPSLGKPVLVTRDKTERPEAVNVGTARLVGADRCEILRITNQLLNDKNEYERMSKLNNPYGDGNASEKILNALVEMKI